MKIRFLAVSAVVAASLFAASCPPVRAAENYDINVILSLTGPGAFLGKGEQQSLQFAEKAVNDAGGIQGRPLNFIFHDDQTNPQIAVQLATDVMAPKPAVILGSSLVATCRAMMPLMADGPVMYCFSPGIHPDAGSYVFTASVSTVDLADAAIRYFRMKGWKRFGLIFSTDASGQDAEKNIDALLQKPENKDIQVTSREHFNTTDVSVSAQIENIKAAKPQALIAWSTGAPIATVFRAIQQAGLDVPVATTDGNMTYAQMTQYKDFLPRQLYIPAAQWVVRDPTLLKPGGRGQEPGVLQGLRGQRRAARHRLRAGMGAGHAGDRGAEEASGPAPTRRSCARRSRRPRAMPASTASTISRPCRSAASTSPTRW